MPDAGVFGSFECFECEIDVGNFLDADGIDGCKRIGVVGGDELKLHVVAGKLAEWHEHLVPAHCGQLSYLDSAQCGPCAAAGTCLYLKGIGIASEAFD